MLTRAHARTYTTTRAVETTTLCTSTPLTPTTPVVQRYCGCCLCFLRCSTLGRYLRMLLTEIKYFNIMLPRIPTKIAREIEVKVMLLDQAAERAVANMRVAHRFKKGAKVRALFSEDDTVSAVAGRHDPSPSREPVPSCWFPRAHRVLCCGVPRVTASWVVGHGSGTRRRWATKWRKVCSW